MEILNGEEILSIWAELYCRQSTYALCKIDFHDQEFWKIKGSNSIELF